LGLGTASSNALASLKVFLSITTDDVGWNAKLNSFASKILLMKLFVYTCPSPFSSIPYYWRFSVNQYKFGIPFLLTVQTVQ
jgi:Na+-transporting NADH:ubiquinone oxidoreductase subunit NqrB